MEIFQQIAAIAFVFALLGGAIWWLRGRNMITFKSVGQGHSRLQMIDRVRLTPQHSVHVIRSGNRDLTIAVHPTGCTLLDTQPSEVTKQT